MPNLLSFRLLPVSSAGHGLYRVGVMTLAGALLFAGCARNRSVGTPAGPGPAGAAAAGLTAASEMPALYREMGLIAGNGTMAFVASASFLPAPSPDSTLVAVALSLPARALAFTREGERYNGEYSVRLEVRRGQESVRLIESQETVRVLTFRETMRTDESVIWQQFLRLAPGAYELSLGIKDASGLRTASEVVALQVPRVASGGLGSPMAVYEAIARNSVDSLPRVLLRPRRTVTFGTDTMIPIYIESSGPTAPDSVQLRVVGEGDVELWKTMVDMPQRLAVRSTTIPIPVTRLGIGISEVQVHTPGRNDTVRTRILVSLGDDLPIATFEDMLSFLRYFALSDQLKALREAPLDKRSEAWATFLRETDPAPNTSEHEGLRDYFTRIRTANARYRDDGPIGWQSDRGTAYVGLGDPDVIYDSGMRNPNARVQQMVWEYRTLRLQLVFLDQTGFGRWRLSPGERGELENAIRRRLAQQSER